LDFAVMGTVIFLGVVIDELLKRRKRKQMLRVRNA
jgi:hypothetical protein